MLFLYTIKDFIACVQYESENSILLEESWLQLSMSYVFISSQFDFEKQISLNFEVLQLENQFFKFMLQVNCSPKSLPNQ